MTLPLPAAPVLRPVGPFDLELLAGMHAACFEDCWNATAFGSLLSTPGSFGLLAESQGEPAGFLVGRAAADEGEVLTFGVMPEHRRRGVGRGLLAAGREELARRGVHRLFLEVAEDNAAAVALYRACGFRPAGRRPGYYRRSGKAPVAALLLLHDSEAS